MTKDDSIKLERQLQAMPDRHRLDIRSAIVHTERCIKDITGLEITEAERRTLAAMRGGTTDGGG